MGGKGDCDEMEMEVDNMDTEPELGAPKESLETDTRNDAEAGKSDEVEESDSVTFSPPIYLQRYGRVRDVIKSYLDCPKYKDMFASTGKTVMEAGCAEFGMLPHLKSHIGLGKIIFVDLDEELLLNKRFHLRPLPAEHLLRISRPKALVVEAYAGCVTKVDIDLHRKNPDIWAVIGIELIEHLHPEVLRGFEEAVFGITRPHLVIVTTPNSDFNEVFNLPPGKFRHWDHKFEWSRMEFQLWCKKIVSEFTNYTFRIEGIGEGPEETRHLGCVSQMAIFEKRSDVEPIDGTKFAWRLESNSYKLVESITYPNYVETRSPKKVVSDEFYYLLHNYFFSKSNIEHYEDSDIQEVHISFSHLLSVQEISKACGGDASILKAYLEEDGFKVSWGTSEPQVTINVREFVEGNLEDNSDSFDDEREERKLCDELDFLDVNKVIVPNDEVWD